MRFAIAAILVIAACQDTGARDKGAPRKPAPGQAAGDLAIPLAKVDDVLSESLADGVTLNEVAARIGCTPSAITHALQRKFGMSFTQYVGRLRVAAAKELLRRTRLSPMEIGRRIGIPDASNFARLFKKFENMTPLEYRKRSGDLG